METFYIIPHTHWDREWRWPIWQTRKLLTAFMGQLMDILDTDEEYHYLLLDGQVAPVVDFLEVCPHQRQRLTDHLKSGRVGIGPWYTLPDLYPVCGESLIRNLNLGIRICGEFGGHLEVGYNSFGWGQTAQLPQIYADYGFETIICAKKVSEERAPHGEFLWESPDGTRLLTSRLGALARSNFFFHTYIDVRYGLNFLSEEFAFSPKKAGMAIHTADGGRADDDYFLTRPRKEHDWSRLASGLEKTIDANGNTLVKDHQLLLSGCDFSMPQPDLTALIRRANEIFPDRRFVNASLETWTKALQEGVKRLPGGGLPVVKGELRDGPACDCSGNALAVRIDLKQQNKQAQNAILYWAEPLLAILSMAGLGVGQNDAGPNSALNDMNYQNKMLEMAWRHILDAQSHDTINGVTQDKTVEDAASRLAQAIEMGQTLKDDGAERLIAAVDFGEGNEDALFLFLVNPLPRANEAVLHLMVDTPETWRAWRLAAFEWDGTPLEIQTLGRHRISAPVHDPEGRPWPLYADRHEICLATGTIPAGGYKVLRIEKAESYQPLHHYWLPMRKTGGQNIVTEGHILENRWIRVSVNANGTFDLTDRTSGRVYQGLGYLEDTGDVGNYWAYYPPYHNRTYYTLTAAPRIRVEEEGPLLGRIGIDHSLLLPAGGTEPLRGFGESRRSDEEVTVPVGLTLTLKKEARWIDVDIRVENRAENHRMRMGLPTGIPAERVAASGHFTVDDRPIIPARDRDGLYWKEMQTLPMQHFVDRSGAGGGLAIISDSFTEYEALDDAGGTLFLTLFRAMNNMIVTGWECVNRYPRQKGSQLLKTLNFSFSLYPHEGDWQTGGVCQAADACLHPPAGWQVMGGGRGDGNQQLPPAASFYGLISDDLILSALKPADDGEGIVVRLFNPTAKTAEGAMRFRNRIRFAGRLSLREEDRGEARFQGCNLNLTVPAGKIVTFRVVFHDPCPNDGGA